MCVRRAQPEATEGSWGTWEHSLLIDVRLGIPSPRVCSALHQHGPFCLLWGAGLEAPLLLAPAVSSTILKRLHSSARHTTTATAPNPAPGACWCDDTLPPNCSARYM